MNALGNCQVHGVQSAQRESGKPRNQTQRRNQVLIRDWMDLKKPGAGIFLKRREDAGFDGFCNLARAAAPEARRRCRTATRRRHRSFKKHLFHRYFLNVAILGKVFHDRFARPPCALQDGARRGSDQGCGQAKKNFDAGVARAPSRALTRTHSTESASSDSLKRRGRASRAGSRIGA